jgi:putative acetyltransferase
LIINSHTAKIYFLGKHMTYIIRHYKERDLKGVLSAWENGSRLAHPFLTDDFMEIERERIPHGYMPTADTWVAESDGEVIGFIALLGNEVGAIFVQPAHHGQGVGRALMDKARELHGDLEVEVFAANSIGRKFYARYGFEPSDEKIHVETGYVLLRLKFTACK